MIDKALIVIIFMYGMSIAFLTVQYSIIDVFHVEITNSEGVVLEPSAVVTWMAMSTYNEQSALIENGTFTGNTTYYNKVETFSTAAAAVAWNLITLLTGTYIFYLIIFLGVPTPLVIGILVMYGFLLSRTIIGYVRGI